MVLGREVGPAYSVMGEEELERHCKGLSWEEVLEVIEARERSEEGREKLTRAMREFL
jgi:hypothetical protein